MYGDLQSRKDVINKLNCYIFWLLVPVSHEHIRRYEGMDMKVLVEGKDDHEEGFVTGRMTNNILVHFAGDESLIGQIVTVHLDECKGFYYMGRLIED